MKMLESEATQHWLGLDGRVISNFKFKFPSLQENHFIILHDLSVGFVYDYMDGPRGSWLYALHRETNG
ncbi:MAG: hypothetical protein Aurels2KO_41680 [Aureliella sp.]